jgi:hypothetical protein
VHQRALLADAEPAADGEDDADDLDDEGAEGEGNTTSRDLSPHHTASIQFY